MASDVFQHKLDECCGNIKQVIIIADDIMVVGYKQDHSDPDQVFTTLLQTVQKCNVKLNFDKLQYKKEEVEALGETYTTSSCRPSKIKVSAMRAMPLPTTKKQVWSFIGMINYLSKFSLRLSELAEPMRELSKDKVPINWPPEHQVGFTQMKREIAGVLVLPYYNSKIQTVLQTDASIKHPGTCLLQEEKAVYISGKSLTDAQKDMLPEKKYSLQWLGQWRNSTTIYMPAILF